MNIYENLGYDDLNSLQKIDWHIKTVEEIDPKDPFMRLLVEELFNRLTCYMEEELTIPQERVLTEVFSRWYESVTFSEV